MAAIKLCVAGFLCLAAMGCVQGVPIVITPGPGAPEDGTPTRDVAKVDAVTPRDGAGAIVITRERGWWPGNKGCTFDVSLDDQHVAGLRKGEQVTLYADPGEHIVGVRIRGEEDCETADAQVAVQVVAHATKKVRLGEDTSHDLIVEASTHGGALKR